MTYYGSWKINDLLTFYANVHNASTGAQSAAAAGPNYRVYEDETSTPILTGSMAALDTTLVGFYSEQITLIASTGFEKGKSYSIFVVASVASVTGTLHHNFQIEAEVDANTVSTTVTPADGSVTAAVIATGAIDADAIAADAVGASELAADAATEIADAIRARQMTEGYAADGVAPTMEQALFQIMQILHEFAISGTTLTVKKLDGSTTAMTFTLDSATTPTSLTRAT